MQHPRRNECNIVLVVANARAIEGEMTELRQLDTTVFAYQGADAYHARFKMLVICLQTLQSWGVSIDNWPAVCRCINAISSMC